MQLKNLFFILSVLANFQAILYGMLPESINESIKANNTKAIDGFQKKLKDMPQPIKEGAQKLFEQRSANEFPVLGSFEVEQYENNSTISKIFNWVPSLSSIFLIQPVEHIKNFWRYPSDKNEKSVTINFDPEVIYLKKTKKI